MEQLILTLLFAVLILVDKKPVDSKRSATSSVSLFKVRYFGLPSVSLHAFVCLYIFALVVDT